MKACFHECVCKHLIALGVDPGSPCPIVETCKYHAAADLCKPKEGKRPYKSRLKSDPTLHDDADIDTSGITEKQFKKAKTKIANAKQMGKLNENQKSALKAMKGKRFKKMNATQKQQIVSIANDL